MKIKSNRVRILHMIRSIDTIAEFGTINLWIPKDYAATVWQLQVIGEAASKVDPSIREQFTDIPWKSIIGFRHYAVHEYEGILHEAILAALGDLPELKNKLQNVISAYNGDF